MPHQESNLIRTPGSTAEIPKEGAFGFMGADGVTLHHLPPGAVVAIIDPKLAEAQGFVLMRLDSVDRHGMKMKCPCGDPKCSRTMSARFTWKGQHPTQGQRR